jgi:hypothetical protein
LFRSTIPIDALLVSRHQFQSGRLLHDMKDYLMRNTDPRETVLTNSTGNLKGFRYCWKSNAEQLADWAGLLCNRTDTWIGKRWKGSSTRVTLRLEDSKHQSFRDVLLDHFAGDDAVSLHCTNPKDGTCAFVAIDIDQHGERNQVAADRNWKDSLELLERAQEHGLNAGLEDSNGIGGYHLWILFPEPVPEQVAVDLTHWLTKSRKDIERFPNKLLTTEFGSALRLPGKHHSRDHWSRFWDGQEWLEGSDAVRFLLEFRPGGTDPRDLKPLRIYTEQRILLEQQQEEARKNSRSAIPQDTDSQEIREALSVIPPEGYDLWTRIGMSLHSWDPVNGFDLWAEWSQTGSTYNPNDWPEVNRTKWESFAGSTVSLGTLFHHAKQHGYQPIRPARVHLSDPEPHLVDQVELPTGEDRTLEEWRLDMRNARLESLDQGTGIFLDRSPTGSGKGHCEIDTVQSFINQQLGQETAGKAALLLPTHDNCEQEADRLQSAGIDAEAFPKLDDTTCPKFDDVKTTVEAGLPVDHVHCFACELNEICEYQKKKKSARMADVQVMTHKRAEQSGFENLNAGYISIHERCDDLMRPVREINSVKGLERTLLALSDMLDRSKFLISGSDHLDDQHGFLNRMRDIGEQVLNAMSEDREDWELIDLKTAPMEKPEGLFNQINRYFNLRRDSHGLAWLISAAAGEFDQVTVRRKRVLGTRLNRLPDDAVIWFNDATAEVDSLTELIERSVTDRTPAGRLPWVIEPVQFGMDITQKTTGSVLRKLIYGHLIANPQTQKLGIIVHQKKLIELDLLQDWARKRISHISYWYGGEEVGSNRWMDECDAIISLGTPRPPESAIAEDLVRFGKIDSANCGGSWDKRYWKAPDTAGNEHTVSGLGYQQKDWKDSHRRLVRMRIVQAIGRGRGLLREGIPVTVYSSEECGLRLSPDEPPAMSEGASKVYELLITSQGMKTPELALCLEREDRQIRRDLQELMKLGLVERLGAARSTRYQVTEEQEVSGQFPLNNDDLRQNVRILPDSGGSDQKPTPQDRLCEPDTSVHDIYIVKDSRCSQGESETEEVTLDPDSMQRRSISDPARFN